MFRATQWGPTRIGSRLASVGTRHLARIGTWGAGDGLARFVTIRRGTSGVVSIGTPVRGGVWHVLTHFVPPCGRLAASHLAAVGKLWRVL